MTEEESEMLSPITGGKAFQIDLAPDAGIGIGTILMTGGGYVEGAPYLPPIHGPGCGCGCGYARASLNNLPYPYDGLDD
jgi:hypothetical protein